jgi:hypothetical protein
MAIYSFGGVVYLAIASCIMCVNSGYFNFGSLNLV